MTLLSVVHLCSLLSKNQKIDQCNNKCSNGNKHNNDIQGHSGNNVLMSPPMRRGSWVMASSSSHLTNSSIRHVGITGSWKLSNTNLDSSPMAQQPY
jgi:hypothetical protein